jgi:hypothetical protein
VSSAMVHFILCSIVEAMGSNCQVKLSAGLQLLFVLVSSLSQEGAYSLPLILVGDIHISMWLLLGHQLLQKHHGDDSTILMNRSLWFSEVTAAWYVCTDGAVANSRSMTGK